MEKKIVFAFDFDGTLASSFMLEDYCMAKACQEAGFPLVNEETVHQFYGPTEDGIIRKIVGDAKFSIAWECFKTIYTEKSKDLKAFDGLHSLLQSLNKETKIALLTGRSRLTLDISLKDIGLDDCFPAIYTGSPFGSNKEASMLSLIHDFHIQKKDVVYIGDTLEDIKMMKNISVDIISAGYSHDLLYQGQLEELNPGNCVNTISQLADKIQDIR
ncbi:MAG: HAD hydrolase-like protein [Bacilli bacterium]